MNLRRLRWPLLMFCLIGVVGCDNPGAPAVPNPPSSEDKVIAEKTAATKPGGKRNQILQSVE